MAKLDITDWCDFVRGAVDDEARAAQMRETLDEASPGVQRTVSLLARVAEVGRADLANPVPEHAVRMVKALGSLRRTEDKVVGLRSLPLRVVFDSWLAPAPAGTRTLESAHRQLVCESEGMTVELRLEHEEPTGGTVVVGQVMRSNGDTTPLGDVPVYVYAGERVVGQTRTTAWGELQMQDLPRRPLELCVQVADDACLRIPIDASVLGG